LGEALVALNKTQIVTPLGGLVLVEQSGVLLSLAFAHRWHWHSAVLGRDFGEIVWQSEASTNLGFIERYFSGELGALREVDWSVRGTHFQESVWRALVAIEPSTTVSYLELAQKIGRPRAVRAVANAVGANRLAIVLPCHRVVGSDGKLTGFAAGLDKKRWLLAHEALDERVSTGIAMQHDNSTHQL